MTSFTWKNSVPVPGVDHLSHSKFQGPPGMPMPRPTATTLCLEATPQALTCPAEKEEPWIYFATVRFILQPILMPMNQGLVVLSVCFGLFGVMT